jgi:hypothetical protein
MKAAADFWRTGALLKAGEEKAGGAEVEEVTGLDCAGAVGSVAGILGLVSGGGTTTEVVGTTGGTVALVGVVVG